MESKYDALRLRNQLCYPLYLCAKEVTRRYQPMLEALDLTYTQYIVMMYMWEVECTNVRAMSRAMMIDPSTLTPILKKLEKKGYIMRGRSAEDERNLLVTLTDAGIALQDAALDIPGRMCACIGLTREEAAALCGLVNKVLDNIEKEM